MKKILIFLLGLSLVSHSYSQILFFSEGTNLDSLKTLLHTASDSERVLIYGQLYVNSHEDSFSYTTPHIDTAWQLAKSLNDTTLMLHLFYCEAQRKMEEKDYHTAIEKAQKIISLNNPDTNERRNSKSSSNWYSVLAYSQIGNAYLRLGDYDNSLRHLYKFLDYSEMINQDFETVVALNNIAYIHLVINQLDKAIVIYKRAIVIADRIDYESLPTIKSKIYISNVYNNIGVAYYRKKLFDQSLQYYSKAFEMRKNMVGHNEYATSLNNLGVIYAEKGNYKKALDYYQQSLAISQKNRKRDSEVNYTINIADAYAHINRKGLANQYIKRALTIADELNHRNVYYVLYETVFDIYRIMGDYKKSLYYHEKFVLYKDSMNASTVQKTMEVLQARYDISIKQEELLKQEKENAVLIQKEKNQRLLKNIAFAGIFVVLILFFLIFNRFKLRRKLLKEENAKIEIETNLKEQQNVLLEEKIKKDHELSDLKQKQLEEKIAHRERELSTSTLYISQRNDMLENIKKMIEQILPYTNARSKTKLRDINKTIQENIELREDWNTFKIHFENVHPDFFTKLKKSFPALTKNDLKLCAYVKIGLSNKEVQRLLNISISGMKTARNRLKKKLNLKAEDRLNDFINDFM